MEDLRTSGTSRCRGAALGGAMLDAAQDGAVAFSMPISRLTSLPREFSRARLFSAGA